jgi:hypothetical protein
MRRSLFGGVSLAACERVVQREAEAKRSADPEVIKAKQRFTSFGYIRKVFDTVTVLAAEKSRFPMDTLPAAIVAKSKFTMTISEADVSSALVLLTEVAPEWCAIKPAAFSSGTLFHVSKSVNMNEVRRKIVGLAQTTSGGGGGGNNRRATLG